MRNDPDDEADVVERAMSQLTVVDGTRRCIAGLSKSLLDVFENEEDRDDNDGPPVLQLVSVPAVLTTGEPGPLSVNASIADMSLAGNIDAPRTK